MVTIKSKKLYRSETDKVFTGLLGGLGEFFDIDPVLLRLGFMLLVIVAGFWLGVVVYIIAAVIVPTKSKTKVYDQKKQENERE